MSDTAQMPLRGTLQTRQLDLRLDCSRLASALHLPWICRGSACSIAMIANQCEQHVFATITWGGCTPLHARLDLPEHQSNTVLWKMSNNSRAAEPCAIGASLYVAKEVSGYCASQSRKYHAD